MARLHRLLERGAAVDNANATMSSSVEHLGVVGRSAAMAKVFATIEKISRYKANVLLLGESGSGKELIARALHARGPRRRHLFVPINCATLGRDLLENELRTPSWWFLPPNPDTLGQRLGKRSSSKSVNAWNERVSAFSS
ncbi:MAG: sigma 54-interacting transcriptional regulator [Polyangia bacterium]